MRSRRRASPPKSRGLAPEVAFPLIGAEARRPLRMVLHCDGGETRIFALERRGYWVRIVDQDVRSLMTRKVQSWNRSSVPIFFEIALLPESSLFPNRALNPPRRGRCPPRRNRACTRAQLAERAASSTMQT